MKINKVLAMLFISNLLLSCLGMDKESIESISFNTTGGGDIKFEITEKGEDFRINIVRYAFKEIDHEIILSSDSKKEYSLVTDLFNNNYSLENDIHKSKGLTGSWTDIQINYYDDNDIVISEINIHNNLYILYDFVTASLK